MVLFNAIGDRGVMTGIWLGHDGPAHLAIAEGRVGLTGAGVPRQARQGALHPDGREARAGDVALRGAARRRQPDAARRRGRVGARTGPADRQHQQPLPLLHRREGG